MDASSAMPQRMRVASLTQEGVRRLCNTSREVKDETRCQILTEYMRKLQRSGYGTKMRADILQGAVKTYRKKEGAEALGIQPIHRLGSHRMEERRREKLQGKTNWFKRDTTGWKHRLTEKEKEMGLQPAEEQQQHQNYNNQHLHQK